MDGENIDMLDYNSGIPLYKQLSNELNMKITSGVWPYNTKIPTEAELGKMYSVSRQTVRLAIDDLKNRGLIIKRQGIGTFVSRPKIESEIASFRFYDVDENSTRQHKQLIDFSVVKADCHVAEKLMIQYSSDVFRIERLFHNDDIPTTLAVSYIDTSKCPTLTRDMVEVNGLYNSLEKYNMRPNIAKHSIVAQIVPNQLRNYLQVEKNSPVFFRRRVSYKGELPVEYVESYTRSDIMQFVFTTEA